MEGSRTHQLLLDINVDSEGNTVLHLAARLAPLHELARIPNDAFRMQYELRRFKEVEKLVPPVVKGLRNADGKTAYMVFADKHEDMKREGEEWMKNAVNVSAVMAMVVLINLTIDCKVLRLSADSPIHLESWASEFILTSAVIGISTSLISLLMFSYIKTCSFTEDDFLYNIPKQFCIGLAALISSIWSSVLVVTIYFISDPGETIWFLPVYCVSVATIINGLNRQSPRLLFSLAFDHQG